MLFCIAFLPSGTHLTKKFSGDNCLFNDEHDEFYRPAGISCEQVWIQRSPPGSGAPDLEVISLETKDISNTLKEFATSNHPWAVKFRGYTKKAYGIDFAGPPPSLNEMIIYWYQEEE